MHQIIFKLYTIFIGVWFKYLNFINRSEPESESQLYFAAKENEQTTKSYENLIYGAQILLSIKNIERNEIK